MKPITNNRTTSEVVDLSRTNRHNMTLRSREGSSYVSFSSEKARRHNSDAMTKALQNPLILDIIFAQLNLNDLKSSRLVCRDWADVGAPLLVKRSRLLANFLYRVENSKLRQGIVTPLSDELLRHLVISDKFDPSVPKGKQASVITKVFTDVANVSRSTRQVTLSVTQPKLVLAFFKGIRSLKSTNIQHVSITSVDIAAKRAIVDNIPSFLTRLKLPFQAGLTSLQFKVFGYIGGIKYALHAFEPLFQTLIDSAPNLARLDVSGAFYPNLEACKNLKVLKFVFEKCAHDTCQVRLTGVTRMLTQVKDSVVELDLAYRAAKAERIQRVRNNADHMMSKLVTLNIHGAFAYPISNFFDEVHLPQLKNVSFNEQIKGCELRAFLKLWGPHEGVQSLSVNLGYRWMKDRFAKKMVRKFPSVKKFELSTDLCKNKYVPQLNEMMEPFKTWDLEESNVVINLVDECSVLVAVLKNMAVWKGAKNVHFEEVGLREDDLSGSIQDVIAHGRGFKSVEISGVEDPAIVEKMQAIFKESGAPIHFMESY